MTTLISSATPAALLALLFTGALSAQSQPLLTPVSNAPATAVAWDRQEKAIDPAITRSRFVRVNTAELRRQAARGFQPLQLDVFGKIHTLDLNRTKYVLDYLVLFGKVRGREGDVILVLAPNDILFGTIHLIEDSYAIAHATYGDIHVLQDLVEAKRSILPKAISVTLPDAGNVNNPKAPANGSATYLDVAVFYTPLARVSAGSKNGIEVTIVSGIEQANVTNRNSSVDAEFRLVYIAETKYTENGSSNDLGRFRNPSDGYMDEVHKARNDFGADMMHLITQPARLSYCGVAYLMTNLSSGFEKYCFGVTVRSCVNSNVMAHELGHNIGCHHDRNNAGGAIYTHAYGFRTGDRKFRTVMAYSPGSRVNVWSSPNVKHLTYVMGKANSEDNVLTIAKTKTTVSRFRATKAVTFCELNGEIKGFLGGAPKMRGWGTPNSAYPPKLEITGQWYFAPGLMVIGASAVSVPYLGGILVPAPQVFLPINPVIGNIRLDASGLGKLPSRSQLWIQVFFADGAAVQGVSATNGMKIIMP